MSPLKPASHWAIAVNCAVQVVPNPKVAIAAFWQSASQVAEWQARAVSDAHVAAQACCNVDPAAALEPPEPPPGMGFPPAVTPPVPPERPPLAPGVTSLTLFVQPDTEMAIPTNTVARRTWVDEVMCSRM